MVIQLNETKEQRIAKASDVARLILSSELFTNPKYRDPEGITAFCGPVKQSNKNYPKTVKAKV